MSTPRVGRGATWRTHVPLVLVLLVAAVAMLLVSTDRWRRGATVLGAALVLAGGLRAVLADDDAGLLAVRARIPDVLVYGGLGVSLVFFAASIDGLGTG